MKLISMREFVIEQIEVKQSTSEFKETIVNYAKFLSQPLTLGMFVPCDDKGSVLEEPKQYKDWLDVKRSNTDGRFDNSLNTKPSCHKYNKAKERVLFEGFEWDGEHVCYSDFWADYLFVDQSTIEDLLDQLPKNEMPTLTAQAIKQIGG